MLGVAISTAHLAPAKRAIDRFRKDNIAVRHVNTIEARGELPAFDVLFSIIVLRTMKTPMTYRSKSGSVFASRPFCWSITVTKHEVE